MPAPVTSWTSPTHVVIGEGAAGRYVGALDDVLLVTDPAVHRLSADRVVLREPGMSDREMIGAVRLARARHPHATVVAVGGGSVLDPCRLAVHGWDAVDADGPSLLPADPRASCDLVCIPSTLGTAAEVSPAAVVREDDRLALVVSPALRARTAVLDPSITDRSDTDALRAGLVEAWARAVVPALAGDRLPVQDRLAGALGGTLLDLATEAVDARWRLAAAIASAQTHTSFLALQRSPFSHVLWPVATEWCASTGLPKQQVLAALLPVWLARVSPARVREVLGEAPDVVISRMVRAWPPTPVPAEARTVAQRVHRRWGAFAAMPVDEIESLVTAAST
jgi:NADP-dependent alcohol dehydrogenase